MNTIIEDIKLYLEAEGFTNIDLERFTTGSKRSVETDKNRICVANAEGSGVGVNQSDSENLFQIRVKNINQRTGRDLAWQITKKLANRFGNLVDSPDAVEYISPIRCVMKPTPFMVDSDGLQVYTTRFKVWIKEVELDTIYHPETTPEATE